MKPAKIGAKRPTALKNCPSCPLQVPTACKSCSCGHIFRKSNSPASSAANTAASTSEPSSASKIRRTERTRRERPQYFSHLEYDNYKPRRKTSEVVSPNKKKLKSFSDVDRAKLLFNSKSKVSDKDDASSSSEDMFSNITSEKALQLAIILADVNRKFMGQNFRPPC
ncbi:hypothetical protein CAPTEDRAFT_192808 [Capitella teleta]|uniref:UPF0547 domain-containing protein n=1 Tax=Capitella teleta TaxID=283909 RepID=R7TKW9_CAPTE|nr:hypothetical protein CAPTEDRAFT_192808 [Capitella teleta]|eukprot:ELT92201.1 hypothetical protein CAPTEDRAFT_192808 [Capitella teleta]